MICKHLNMKLRLTMQSHLGGTAVVTLFFVIVVLAAIASLHYHAKLSTTVLESVSNTITTTDMKNVRNTNDDMNKFPKEWLNQNVSEINFKSMFGKEEELKLTSRCILYDRPPRTGSTTVSNALAACLYRRRFKLNSFINPDFRNEAIPRALRLSRSPSRTHHSDFAIVSSHVWMSQHDVDLLHMHCGDIIYITSTAEMWKRIWSAAKMISVKERNGNTKLDRERLNQAVYWLNKTNHPYAQFYDVYPWIRLTGPQRLREDGKHMEEIPSQYEIANIEPRFHPDFVIRNDHLLHDLSSVLTALGCRRLRPRSTNIHKEIDIADDAILSIKKSVIDAIGNENGSVYSYLMDRSKYNQEGLKRISSIMFPKRP